MQKTTERSPANPLASRVTLLLQAYEAQPRKQWVPQAGVWQGLWTFFLSYPI